MKNLILLCLAATLCGCYMKQCNMLYAQNIELTKIIRERNNAVMEERERCNSINEANGKLGRNLNTCQNIYKWFMEVYDKNLNSCNKDFQDLSGFSESGRIATEKTNRGLADKIVELLTVDQKLLLRGITDADINRALDKRDEKGNKIK